MARRDSGASGCTDPVAELLEALLPVASALGEDLREQVLRTDAATRLRAEHAAARAGARTARSYETWLPERLTHTTLAWLLATTMVRYCEDNALIEEPFLGGGCPERTAQARRRQAGCGVAASAAPDLTWLVEALQHAAATNETLADLLHPTHNPLWHVVPSPGAASALLEFWRGGGTVPPAPDLTGWDPGFLEELSRGLAAALGGNGPARVGRSRAAVAAGPGDPGLAPGGPPGEAVPAGGPDHVDLLLDLTLDRAVEEFGVGDGDVPELRVLDPACRFGTTLVTVFERVLGAWRGRAPDADAPTLVRRALASVHGVDKDPCAAGVARFRLLVAACRAAGIRSLRDLPDLRVTVAVGDSLLHGRGAPRFVRDEETLFDVGEVRRADGSRPDTPAVPARHSWAVEDVDRFVASRDLLGQGSYHVVVGEAPSAPVRDRQEAAGYRARYDTCSGTFTLSVPFVQRCFHLAVRTGGHDRAAGFVGLFVETSFMHREFGRRLVERFLPTVHLTHVIDTPDVGGSGRGALGAPPSPVALIGRNHVARAGEPVRVLCPGGPGVPVPTGTGRGRRGGPAAGPARRDLDRAVLASHPWGIGDGGAAGLVHTLGANASDLLSRRASEVRAGAVIGADDAFVAAAQALRRVGTDSRYRRALVENTVVRDFGVHEPREVLWPYASPTSDAVRLPAVERFLWPARTAMRARAARRVRHEPAPPWYGYAVRAQERPPGALSLVLAGLAAQNHVALERGGHTIDHSVVSVTLPEGSSEEEHLGLLAVLNSSTACFWLLHACRPRSAAAAVPEGSDPLEPWERERRFTPAKVRQLPLPGSAPAQLARDLEMVVRRMAAQEPAAVCGRGVPTREVLDGARTSQEALRRRMTALQEELDWQVYGAYGLLSSAESRATTVPSAGTVPPVAPGERAFEILLARRAGPVARAWFSRQGITPVREVPEHWPAAYRRIVQARVDLLGARADLGLVETPECKRRWAVEPWELREGRALRRWLLERCEDWSLWIEVREGVARPRVQTVAQLAERLRREPDARDVVSVAELYATSHLGSPGLDLGRVLEGLLDAEHVPYLAAWRLRPGGMLKRSAWERVWEHQRAEDGAGEGVGCPASPEGSVEEGVDVRGPVPPRYRAADFHRPTYWELRGQYDLPAERFVSYPGASTRDDPSLLLGWGGWNHRDQAQALADLVRQRSEHPGWGVAELTPLLAGLLEILPWVRQWHAGDDPGPDGDAVTRFETLLRQECARQGVTDRELRAWRPDAESAAGSGPSPA